MESKRIIGLLSFVFVFAFAFSVPQTLIAENARAGTWITTNDSGTELLISTSYFTDPNRRTWSLVGESLGTDWTFGGEFDSFFPGVFVDIAPVQEQSFGEGWMTGPKRFENMSMQRIRHTDGSIAYIMLWKGKATVIDTDTIKIILAIYICTADGDGLPNGILFPLGEYPYTSRYLSTAVPLFESLPAPADYPEP